jgi:membrane associated rhomboid family serine protease
MSLIRQPFKYRNDGVVFWLIGINVLFFAVTWLLSRNVYAILAWGKAGERLLVAWSAFLERMPMRPVNIIGRKWVWTFITYMFMHGGFNHILFNMLGLLIFGRHVERQMGSSEFLLYYMLTGAAAGLFSFVLYYLTRNYAVALIGASGALFAVELAYAVFFPDSILYIWGIIPLRAPILVLGYTALEIIFSVTGRNDGVAHFTHLAGFGAGWVYFLLRFGVNPWRRLLRR